ncbi:hypothetical protein G7Y89_g11915 [Cudoniella acicularis]|uniref:Major facilitator superfamily (MFS) profile domain-containing protein n=1 Tax=Cudoniella acicularis TaxID=354080 RepID=A0A8H4RB30_9HELO|nr:hypothetical protein G7Y89_g11915 [Cudoniella acicularis]
MNFTNSSTTEGADSDRESNSESFYTELNGEADTMTPAPTAKMGDPSSNKWLCCIIMFVLVLASSSLEAPTMQLLENAACHEYYHRYEPGKYLPYSHIPETECKSGPIQAYFAMLITITSVGANLVELMVQLPLGILADRRGGKLVLLLNILSAVLYWTSLAVIGFRQDLFPIWCYYIVPFFLSIGGGPRVSNAMLFTVLNDSISLEQRTTAFSLLEAVAYTTDFFAASIGSTLMSVGLSLPFICSVTCFAVASIPTLLLSGNPAATRNRPRKAQLDESPDDPGFQPLLDDVEEVRSGSTKRLSIGNRFIALFIEPWTSFPFNKTIVLCLGIFTLIAAAKTCVRFLIAYLSQRYKWNIAQV